MTKQLRTIISNSPTQAEGNGPSKDDELYAACHSHSHSETVLWEAAFL